MARVFGFSEARKFLVFGELLVSADTDKAKGRTCGSWETVAVMKLCFLTYAGCLTPDSTLNQNDFGMRLPQTKESCL